MVDARDRARARGAAHPEEWLSILGALAAAALALAFFWLDPTFQPANGFVWAIPGWIALAYLFFQMVLLLVSATQIRVLGVFNSIVSILPFVGALVTATEWLLGHLPLSGFQLNALISMVCVSLGEFLLTVWIRFVVNRRTIGIDTQ